MAGFRAMLTRDTTPMTRVWKGYGGRILPRSCNLHDDRCVHDRGIIGIGGVCGVCGGHDLFLLIDTNMLNNP